MTLSDISRHGHKLSLSLTASTIADLPQLVLDGPIRGTRVLGSADGERIRRLNRIGIYSFNHTLIPMLRLCAVNGVIGRSRRAV